MWQKTVGFLGCALSVVACGAAPAPAPKVAEAPSAPPVAPAPPAARSASAELRRYWIFGDKPQLEVYAGVDSLMHTELFAGLVPGILEQSEDFLSGTQKACVHALANNSRELLAGADQRSGLLILELGPEGVKAVRSACVGSVLPVQRVSVAGADEAYASGSDVVVVEPGVVLFGSKEIVEAALAGVKNPAPLPAALTLTEDQQLVFRFTVPNPEISASGALRVSPERFRLEANVDVPNDEMAAMAERKLQQAREQANGLQQAQPDVPVKQLLSAFDVQRHGRHFTSSFELREPVVEQARHLGILIGMSVYGVRRYMMDAKSAEARAVMSQIARNISAVMQEPAEKGKAARPKKLVSLPAVPASVPRGVKYQSSPDDWKAWSLLHFTISDPQFFQYEVVAAKDGKTAEILARGDLNGDGKTSLYRLKIALDPKTGAITAVDHSEQDPLE